MYNVDSSKERGWTDGERQEKAPQAQAHGAAQKNGKSGGQHSGGHSLRPDSLSNPEIV